jgi:hypothetical protein
MLLAVHGGWWGLALVAVAGAFAAAINAVAGGGSLISFPILVALGIPPLQANATNSVGIWPGSLGSALGFLHVEGAPRQFIRAFIVPTILGSMLGAWLLVVTSPKIFDAVVPVLILGATLLLAFQPQIRRWTQGNHRLASIQAGWVLQFLVATYGGYFGAGMGIMMLAVLSMLTTSSIHELNAIKAWLGIAINFIASAVLITQGLVLPLPGIAIAIGAIIGGFFAARLSLKLDAEKLRVAIVVLGFAMVAVFTYRTFA